MPVPLPLVAIARATNVVTATIPVGFVPGGLAVTPDGSKVYVVNEVDNTVSVIATATNIVTGSPITVGSDPVAFGVFIQPPVVQSAPASGTACNGVYDSTFNGNITVSARQNCAFLNGGKITSNVTMTGGNFVLNGSSVGVNLTVNGGGTFTLGPGATIGNNLTIANIPPGTASNSVCGTMVFNNLTFSNNGTAVQIGSNAPLTCAGNEIGGSLSAVDDTNSVLIFDNSVGVNTTVNNNTGPLDVVGNTVGNNLLCVGNSMLMMRSGNTARQKIGQCN
jgi:YVTN family beta-propeller protein